MKKLSIALVATFISLGLFAQEIRAKEVKTSELTEWKLSGIKEVIKNFNTSSNPSGLTIYDDKVRATATSINGNKGEIKLLIHCQAYRYENGKIDNFSFLKGLASDPNKKLPFAELTQCESLADDMNNKMDAKKEILIRLHNGKIVYSQK